MFVRCFIFFFPFPVDDYQIPKRRGLIGRSSGQNIWSISRVLRNLLYQTGGEGRKEKRLHGTKTDRTKVHGSKILADGGGTGSVGG